jgi:hypothetical protein
MAILQKISGDQLGVRLICTFLLAFIYVPFARLDDHSELIKNYF